MSKSNYESIFDSIKVTQAHGPQPKNLAENCRSSSQAVNQSVSQPASQTFWTNVPGALRLDLGEKLTLAT
ncbi:GM14508 [Drosophila sechellia]|uniref:GM14508 n=1 Tax=Drosophila sechellia TaxID=7238 RepID=B4HTF8_DROSE|nr:GM14508 [Drosophila sechellia]